MKRRIALTALLAGVVLGCAETPLPPAPHTAVVADAPSAEQKALLALDCYDPMYLLDADGHVMRLRLPNRHLSLAALAEIGKLTELQNLDLYGTTVTDEGLALLKSLQKLKTCGLGGTAVTDKGLVHLEKMQGLHHVWLPTKTVSKAGVEKLREARPDLNVHLQ